jgi:hypothetical protein
VSQSEPWEEHGKEKPVALFKDSLAAAEALVETSNDALHSDESDEDNDPDDSDDDSDNDIDDDSDGEDNEEDEEYEEDDDSADELEDGEDDNSGVAYEDKEEDDDDDADSDAADGLADAGETEDDEAEQEALLEVAAADLYRYRKLKCRKGHNRHSCRKMLKAKKGRKFYRKHKKVRKLKCRKGDKRHSCRKLLKAKKGRKFYRKHKKVRKLKCRKGDKRHSCRNWKKMKRKTITKTVSGRIVPQARRRRSKQTKQKNIGKSRLLRKEVADDGEVDYATDGKDFFNDGHVFEDDPGADSSEETAEEDLFNDAHVFEDDPGADSSEEDGNQRGDAEDNGDIDEGAEDDAAAVAQAGPEDSMLSWKTFVPLLEKAKPAHYKLKGAQFVTIPKGAPSSQRKNQGTKYSNCVLFTAYLIPIAFDKAFDQSKSSRQYYRWMNIALGDRYPRGFKDMQQYGVTVVGEWGVGEVMPRGAKPVEGVYLLQTLTAAGGHSWIILDYDLETDKILTLESNKGFGLDGVGFATLGNYRDVVKEGGTALRNWKQTVTQTWTKRTASCKYGTPFMARLNIDHQSVRDWIASH